MSSQTGRRSPASSSLPTERNGPKLAVEGRTPDGRMKLKVTLPGLIGDGPRPFTLARGPDVRPLQFDGELLAEVERDSNHPGVRVHNPFGPDVYRAAVYKTRGGRFVTEFSTLRGEDREGKAEVFDSLDSACAWFRQGPLTTELLKKLGKWDPEFIE
jgi:hypothetical protein